MKRADFIKKFAYGGSILLTAPLILSACSGDDDEFVPEPNIPNNLTIDLSSSTYEDLGSIGGYVYEGDILIFRTGDSAYLALSKICTHQSCTVAYDHSNGNILCPCHSSRFTTAGAVINGPATSSLKKYSVQKNGDILTIS
ncbi:Rieske (2Fe-2S) protein [Draconibacterium sp. IB214405]|uniref:QcrA and Rieske domain-containing protein n=1 Tax=Draconibacterium sp. IB214405 TaxID=3097352 RepID=UPI002A118A1E|nr:Rieske (2Fe-2S) protein [Draconibacterium sp. IB214405]MDX8339976.1 Rieske (2Fe-2S) protein [Draconibacterium sp. IB214405]